MRDMLLGTGWKVREFISENYPLYVAVIEKES
jgi:hypothetical protein